VSIWAAQSLREALGERATRLVGTFAIIPRIEILEIAAQAGFDLVALDWEHGPYGLESSSALVAAGHRTGIFVIVRVPPSRPELVGAALDIGADGVIVPHVDSPERAREAAAAARFPPLGERSANPWVRAADYSGSADFFVAANRKIACITTIEGRGGLEHAEAIVSTPGVDAIFIGPVDLSASLGFPGEVDHPIVESAITTLIGAASARSVAVSIFTPTAAAARRWLTRGARLVLVGVDTAHTLDGFKDALSALSSPD
jgi:4-hydroxy-2-oxoheptanedioate aldolase